MKYLKYIITLIILIIFILSPVNVLADQAQPDSTPTVEIDVYRHLIETDDYFILIYANIPYASTPNATMPEAFIWKLLDTDETTVLGTTTGNYYNDNGYGYNVYSMYFSADDAPTWSTSYPLVLYENPVIFDTPTSYTFYVTASDYTALTDPEDISTALSGRILTIAQDLDIQWSTLYSLVTGAETELKLSQTGETFFRTAIYGIQQIAPDAFQYGFLTIEQATYDWTEEYGDNLTAQSTGTWIETAQEAGADLMGTSYDLTTIILTIVICAGVVFVTIYVAQDIWAGLINAGLVALLFARAGLIELSFIILIASLLWIYVSAKTWGVVS